MAINVSVQQYNGGLLLDIILLLTQCYYHHRNPFKYHEEFFCLCSLRSHFLLNVLTFSPLTGGYSEGLDAFSFFFKNKNRVVHDYIG